MLRAVSDVIRVGVLPSVERLDVMPFRRAVANSATLNAVTHALQPALIHIFEHGCDPAAYAVNPPAPLPPSRVVPSTPFRGDAATASTSEGGASGAGGGGPPSNSTLRMSLHDFGRVAAGAGLLSTAALSKAEVGLAGKPMGDAGLRERGIHLTSADVGGAFAAASALQASGRGGLAYDGFAEAILRLAATSGDQAAEGEGAVVAAIAARNAAAAAAVVSPSPTLLTQPITLIDEAALLSRLAHLVGRMLLAVLEPGASSAATEHALAAVEEAAIARATSGEPEMPQREVVYKPAKGARSRPLDPPSPLGFDASTFSA